MTSHQGAAQVTRTEPNLTEPALTHGTLTEGADPAASRILIVDDEPNIRSFIGRALSAAGYLTGFAASGTEGLRHALDAITTWSSWTWSCRTWMAAASWTSCCAPVRTRR